MKKMDTIRKHIIILSRRFKKLDSLRRLYSCALHIWNEERESENE